MLPFVVHRELLWSQLWKNANRVASSKQGCVENRFEEIIGDSPALESALAEVERVAPTDSTVLVLERPVRVRSLIARAIHHISPRCGRPFIKLNCAAIPFDCWKANSSDTRKARSLGLSFRKLAASKWLTLGHCSWMK